jgi:hypothetical protein
LRASEIHFAFRLALSCPTLHGTEYGADTFAVAAAAVATRGDSYGMSMGRRSRAEAQAVSISVASKITGVEVHTLRYWEREFSEFLRPHRTAGGQRRYRPGDIQTVFLLKRLLRDEMFSIAGARKHLRRPQERHAA